MQRNEPDARTKAELVELGKQLMKALEPFVDARPGLELVLCYAIPYGADRATAVASTITDPKDLVLIYAKAGAGLINYAKLTDRG